MLDRFLEAGGTFIDTPDVCGDEQSERTRRSTLDWSKSGVGHFPLSGAGAPSRTDQPRSAELTFKELRPAPRHRGRPGGLD